MDKTCTVCNIEKLIDNFHKKYSECKYCNIKRSEYVSMITKKKYHINKNYIMKKIELNYYRNKMITGIKETQIVMKYLDHMLN